MTATEVVVDARSARTTVLSELCQRHTTSFRFGQTAEIGYQLERNYEGMEEKRGRVGKSRVSMELPKPSQALSTGGLSLKDFSMRISETIS